MTPVPRLLPLLALLAAAGPAVAADGPVIDSMDTLRFLPPKEKGAAEVVDGKAGKAVRFAFEKDAKSAFFTSNTRGTPDWDKAAGFSFWVKGDGTGGVAGLQFIYDEDYAVRYDYAFPVRGTDWTNVTVAWRDLVPVLPGPKSNPLDPAGPNKPSRLSGLWVGKWWYWGDYPAVSFALDDVRLEPTIDRPADPPKPAGPPLERVLAKLKAGKPVTVVTMGDSLTDYRHHSNRQVAWPKLLQKALHDKYGSEVTIVNPAIGGTQLRQNLVLVPRWRLEAPEPDLVTVLFGGNDWDAGMRGGQFREATIDAVDRLRRATGGKSDVLLMTTVPAVKLWTDRAELGDAVRAAAADRAAGLADTEGAFHEAGKRDKERLFDPDGVHLSPAGHELVAAAVLAAVERAGK